MTTWVYRVVAFYLYDATPPARKESESSSPIPGLSKDFLAQQFPDQQQASRQTNSALQIQELLDLYGSRGWQHYLQSQVGPHWLLYFRRPREASENVEPIPLTTREAALLQMLDPSQHP